MPYIPPDKLQILQRMKTDFRVELGADPLRRTVEYALIRALMGQSSAHYGATRYYFNQLYPDTAEDQYLWRWVGIFLGQDGQKPATYWLGTVQFNGTNATVIPSGTTIVRSDGIQFSTTASGSITGGYATCTATSEDPGAAADIDVGQPLALGSPITGVATTCYVTTVTQSGVDPESVSAAKTRLLQRLSSPPKGGGPGDYVAWALSYPGCTRAWEFPRLEGPGSVSVAFARDADGLGVDALPDASERAEMLAYLVSKVPVTVDPYVIELIPRPVNIVISGLDPDTVEVRASITLGLQDLFSRESEPAKALPLSRIDAAISAASGEYEHTLVSPTVTPVAATNEMLVLGTVESI